MKITSDAYLYTLNITLWKGQLKSCLKRNQTGRLRTDLDADALYYTVIVKCPAGLERVTRSLHNLAALQLVCDGGGGNVLESYGATQKGTGEAAFCPLLRQKCFLYTRLRMQKYKFAQHHNDTGQEGFPLSFYASCSLSMPSADFLCNLVQVRYEKLPLKYDF